jgi:hypothetical protein
MLGRPTFQRKIDRAFADQLEAVVAYVNKMDVASRNVDHYKENPIYVFLFWELRGLSPNFHVQVSVSDIYSIFPGSVHILPE